MRKYLLMKHTLKENYKYFFSLALIYAFMAVIYHVTLDVETRDYIVQTLVYALTILNALVLPSILFKNYYKQTEVHHMASIPFKRSEMFISNYFLGFIISTFMLLGYSLLTIYLKNATMFLSYASALLFAYIFYYHLSLLSFFICGQMTFNFILVDLLIIGPMLVYFVYQWSLQTYDRTYVTTTTLETLFKLIPAIGSIYPYLEQNSQLGVYEFYLIVSIVLFALSYVAMRYRCYEATGQSIVYKKLSIVIRIVMILVLSSSLYAFIGSLFGTVEHILLAIISSIMVAYIVEMAYMRSAKVYYSAIIGIVAGLMIYGGVKIGVKANENYIPYVYDAIYLEGSDYTSGAYYDQLEMENPKLVKTLHEEMKSYYQTNAYDIRYNQHLGYLTFNYKKGQDTFYARRYAYTQDMIDMILNKDEYRSIFIQLFTHELDFLLEEINKQKVITFYIGEETYILDTEQEYYLFENYLAQEKESVLNSTGNIFDSVYSSHTVSWDYDEYSGYQNSQILYNTLSKTFGF